MKLKKDGEGRRIVIPDDGLDETVQRQFMASLAPDQKLKDAILASKHTGNGIYTGQQSRHALMRTDGFPLFKLLTLPLQ